LSRVNVTHNYVPGRCSVSMATFVLATNAPSVSEQLSEYLAPRLTSADTVHVVNSQQGGDATDADAVDRGKAALETAREALTDVTTVETHQLVRGNDPAEDVFAVADEVGADELVIGVRKRSQANRLVFGSVAQDIMRRSDYPMRVVPRE